MAFLNLREPAMTLDKFLDKLVKSVSKALGGITGEEVRKRKGSVVAGDLIVTPLENGRVRVQRGECDMEDSFDKLPLMLDAAFGLLAGLRYLAERDPADTAAQRRFEAAQLARDFPQKAIREYLKQDGTPAVADTAAELVRELSARKLDYAIQLVPGPKLRLIPPVAGPAPAEIYHDNGETVVDAAGVRHRARGIASADEMASWLAPFTDRVSVEADDEEWAKDIAVESGLFDWAAGVALKKFRNDSEESIGTAQRALMRCIKVFHGWG
jgi:hypothetical protein